MAKATGPQNLNYLLPGPQGLWTSSGPSFLSQCLSCWNVDALRGCGNWHPSWPWFPAAHVPWSEQQLHAGQRRPVKVQGFSEPFMSVAPGDPSPSSW